MILRHCRISSDPSQPCTSPTHYRIKNKKFDHIKIVYIFPKTKSKGIPQTHKNISDTTLKPNICIQSIQGVPRGLVLFFSFNHFRSASATNSHESISTSKYSCFLWKFTITNVLCHRASQFSNFLKGFLSVCSGTERISFIVLVLRSSNEGGLGEQGQIVGARPHGETSNTDRRGNWGG